MTLSEASVQPLDGETLDRISDRRRVLQRRKGHRSATDDVLAAWSALAAAPHAERVLDLGCGHGTVTLHLSEALPDAEFVAVEVQEVSASLARRNMLLNGLQDRVIVLRSDLRELGALEPPFAAALIPGFDLVTGTPPFMPLGSGVLPADPQRAAGRFELRGGIEAYCAAAAHRLRPGGRVSFLMDGAQDERCKAAFVAAGLHLDRVVVVTPRPGRRVRYRGYIGGLDPVASPPQEVPLLVREEDGAYTAAMKAVREAVLGVRCPSTSSSTP